MTTMKAQRKLVMRACPRCHGDLLRDDYEEEFVCIQCGRRTDIVGGEPVIKQPEAIRVITAPPPIRALTRAEARMRRRKAAA